MNVLIVGGAGYIGSHMVKLLDKNGCNIIILDNLSTGHRDALLAGEFINDDLENRDAVNKVFQDYKIDVVMHFASSIVVGESMTNPSKYYRNNVNNTLNILDAMVEHGVKYFVFSSTAAIYGEPQYVPIDEKHAKEPVSPYGRSKWMVEQILEDYDSAYGLKSVCLRYFNAAGASHDCLIGERHDPETHLIPLVLQAALGKRENIVVYGRDYKTSDGTCVRDYVHVSDLCEAHWLAVKFLFDGNTSNQFNLGGGKGFSVQGVIDTCCAVTGVNISIANGDRRRGDPDVLIADSSRAAAMLGWSPKFKKLSDIVESAWFWETSR